MSASGQTSAITGVRRRIPRYAVAVPMDVTVLRAGTSANIPGRSLDIGEGGVAAVLAAELQPGEWVAVEFQLPNAVQSLQTKAVVRHQNQLRCGFEFLELSGDQRSMIRRWAGISQPLPSTPPAAATPAAASISSAPVVRPAAPGSGAAVVRTPQAHPAPLIPPRPRPAARPARHSDLARLMRMTAALLIVIAIWAAWQWHRGWQQLESRTAPRDVHAQAPTARVAPEVMDRLLIRKVDPVYPDFARRSNLQGVVVLDAMIAADGSVVNLHPASGPEGFISPAMDAARWWRFRPYRVRGEPAAVETTLTVEFHP